MDMPPQSPSPDADLLTALLDDLQRDFSEMLTLMEQSVSADPDVQSAEASAFQHRIAELQCKTDAGLKSLDGVLRPWAERRSQLPAELARRVDRFLDLLATGLQGIARQVDFRLEDIRKRRTEISGALENLNSQRKGLQGYRQKQDPSKIVREEA